METLKEYRNKVNVSQSVMAEILKTTRSQISMAERGERPLPAEAKRRFAVMQTMMVDLQNLPSNDGFPLADDDIVLADETLAIWQGKLTDNHWQQYALNIKLKNMKKEFGALLAQQIELWKATVAIPETGGSAIEVEFFKDKQKRIRRKILTCGRIAQLRLQLSIDLLVAEAGLLNQYVLSATAERAAPV